MKNMNWTAVKKQLKYCSERDLLGIIQGLYQLNRANQNYLHLRFVGENHPAGKANLLEKMITGIQTGWGKGYHDPYGYGGVARSVKVTPIKKWLTTYKKAIGVDEGYLILLAEYILGGCQFLQRNAFEESHVVISSINTAARELFALLEKAAFNRQSLSSAQWKVILQQFFRQVEQSVDSSVVRIH